MKSTTGGGGSSSAYAHCYKLAVGAETNIAAGADITLSNNGPIQDISHTAGSADVTINTTGVYKIDYGIVLFSGIGTELALLVNGVAAPSARIYCESAAGSFHGSAILSLNATDVIKLRNNSSAGMIISASPNLGAEMTITKVN